MRLKLTEKIRHIDFIETLFLLAILKSLNQCV